MQHDLIISIDAGSKGAAVSRYTCNAQDIHSLELYKDEHTPADLAFNTAYTTEFESPVVIIERVWASPVMGVSASFNFGYNYASWIYAFKMVHVPIYSVTPQIWQKVVAPEIEGQGSERKKKLKDKAVELFPNIRVTLSNCDALLLSEYALIQLEQNKPLGEPL